MSKNRAFAAAVPRPIHHLTPAFVAWSTGVGPMRPQDAALYQMALAAATRSVAAGGSTPRPSESEPERLAARDATPSLN